MPEVTSHYATAKFLTKYHKTMVDEDKENVRHVTKFHTLRLFETINKKFHK